MIALLSVTFSNTSGLFAHILLPLTIYDLGVFWFFWGGVCNQALVIWTVRISTRSNNGNLKRHPTKSGHDTIADLFTAISAHVMGLKPCFRAVVAGLTDVEWQHSGKHRMRKDICLCPIRKCRYSLLHRAQREVFSSFAHPHLWNLQIWLWLCILAWIPSIIQKPQPRCINKQQTRGLADPSSSNRQLCGPETTIYQQANVSGSSGPRVAVRVNWEWPSRLKRLAL